VTETESRSAGSFWLVTFLVMLTAIPALLFYPLPSHDGHQHVFTAFAFNRLGDGTFGFGTYLQRGFPLSSQGFVLLLAALDVLLPFAVAERVAVALMLGMFPISGALYARLTARSTVACAGMMALAAHSWILLMGFYNFMLGMALVPVVVGFAAGLYRERPAGPLRFAAISLALVALAWLHLLAAAFAGLVILALAAGHGPGRFVRVWRTVLLGLPAAAYCVWISTGYVEAHESVGVISTTASVWEPFATRVLDLFRTAAGGVHLATGLVFWGLTGWLTLAWFRGRATPERGSLNLLVLAWLLSLVFLVAPISVARWAYFSPRLAFCSMIAFAMVIGLRKDSLVGLAVTIALIFSNIGLYTLHDRLQPLTEAVARAPRTQGAPLLAMELSNESLSGRRYMSPTQHVALRSLISGGGVSPYLFAFNPNIHSITYQSDPSALGPVPGQWLRRGFDACADDSPEACFLARIDVADRLAVYGLHWPELMLLNAPLEVAMQLRHRGYHLVHAGADDTVQVWRSRGGSVGLEIAVPSNHLEAPLQVRVGLTSSVGWFFHGGYPPGPVPEGLIRVLIEPLPSGPVRLQVFSDGDQDGEPSEVEWAWEPSSLEIVPEEMQLVHTVVGQDSPSNR